MRTGRPLTFSAAEIRRIRRLAACGVRTPEIGRRLGRKWKGVWELMKRLGIPRQEHNKFPQGQRNPAWNGGWHVDKDGYIYVLCKDHPLARGKGYVREHRLVMETHLGRYLTEQEVIHHKDGNRKNNRISNLALFARNGLHLKHELTGRVPNWTPKGRRRILEAIRRPRARRRSANHS